MYKILITGSGGLVGSHILEKLACGRNEIVAIYNSKRPVIDCVTNLKLEKVDLIKDPIGKYFTNDFDYIIHSAAIFPSLTKSDEYCKVVNKKIDDNLISFCQQNPKTKVIFISSIYIETIAENNSNAYLQGKLETEKLLSAINNDYCILRISSPYGKGQTTKNVLYQFAVNYLNNKDISYYGNGERTQDFIEAHDIALAVEKVISTNVKNEILNICSASPISMKELALLFKSISSEYTGQVISVSPLNNTLNEEYKANFSNKKTQELLSWQPTISLSDGIKRFVTSL